MSIYKQGNDWYFGDEAEQANGPFATRGEAVVAETLYGYNLDQPTPLPIAGKRYRHHKGQEYTVLGISGHYADRVDCPPRVIYQGDNGRIWDKPLAEFLDKLTPISPTGPVQHQITDKGPVRVSIQDNGVIYELAESDLDPALLLLPTGPVSAGALAELLPYLAYFLAAHKLPDNPIN